MSEEKTEKKKSGFVKILVKLLTLGGLFVVIYKALQKNKEVKDE